MKKVFGIIALTLLVGCTASEDTATTNNTDCDCGEVVSSISYNINQSTYTTIQVRNNCSGIIKTVSTIPYQVLNNSQWCD